MRAAALNAWRAVASKRMHMRGLGAWSCVSKRIFGLTPAPRSACICLACLSLEACDPSKHALPYT